MKKKGEFVTTNLFSINQTWDVDTSLRKGNPAKGKCNLFGLSQSIHEIRD